MNGHTDSRERAVHGQLLAQSSHVARKEGDQADHSSQVSGSWVPVSPRVTEMVALGEGGSNGVSEKHVSSTYILKVESTGFAH